MLPTRAATDDAANCTLALVLWPHEAEACQLHCITLHYITLLQTNVLSITLTYSLVYMSTAPKPMTTFFPNP